MNVFVFDICFLIRFFVPRQYIHKMLSDMYLKLYTKSSNPTFKVIDRCFWKKCLLQNPLAFRRRASEFYGILTIYTTF